MDGQAPVQGNKSLSSSLYRSGPTDYIFYSITYTEKYVS